MTKAKMRLLSRASKLAVGPIEYPDAVIDPVGLPTVVYEALNAEANGVRYRQKKNQE